MDKKFMLVKKVVLPILTLAIMMSSFTGCGAVERSDMIDMINRGESITLEVPVAAYQMQGEYESQVTWIQLDQLKTYNEGFRQGFDEVFNINIVTYAEGQNGKSGVLFVDREGDRNGNTTLQDAFRNKVFINKYWGEQDVKTAIGRLADKAYVDVKSGSNESMLAAFNAYYNLFNDSRNPSSYNGGQSLTREQFYTGLYKSFNPVQDLEYNAETDVFTIQVGGETEYTRYAAEVAPNDFLQTSLTGTNISRSISRAEAVYLVVNTFFKDELNAVGAKDVAFTDCKNAGDLALKVGFKEQDKKTKEVTIKDGWEAYTLSYMLQEPDKGMQQELYNAMVVAKNLNLIQGSESRWDESITKNEAIHLIISAMIAQNNKGFMSEVEYGAANPTKDTAISINNEGEVAIAEYNPLDSIDAHNETELNEAISQAEQDESSTGKTEAELQAEADAALEAAIKEAEDLLNSTPDPVPQQPQTPAPSTPAPSNPAPSTPSNPPAPANPGGTDSKPPATSTPQLPPGWGGPPPSNGGGGAAPGTGDPAENDGMDW